MTDIPDYRTEAELAALRRQAAPMTEDALQEFEDRVASATLPSRCHSYWSIRYGEDVARLVVEVRRLRAAINRLAENVGHWQANVLEKS